MNSSGSQSRPAYTQVPPSAASRNSCRYIDCTFRCRANRGYAFHCSVLHDVIAFTRIISSIVALPCQHACYSYTHESIDALQQIASAPARCRPRRARPFVLSLVWLPPLVVFVRNHYNPDYIRNKSKVIAALEVVLYALGIFKITIPYLTSPLKNLPQPPKELESFIFGNLRSDLARPIGKSYLDWMNTVPNNGLIYTRGFMHGFPRLVLTTPEAIQEVLVTRAYDWVKPAPGRIMLERTLGKGLIVVEGAEHKMQRKSVAPAFQGKQIRDLVPLFWQKSKELVDVLAGQLDTSPDSPEKKRAGVVDLTEWASRVTLDIIGVAGVGRDFGSLHNSDDPLVKQYETILDPDKGNLPLFFLMSIAYPSWLARRNPIKKHREIALAREELRVICRRLVADKRREMGSQSEKHIDILSVLIRSGSFTDEGLVNQLLTFLAAGHETTSNALQWTCYLLATHPEIQDRLRSELRGKLDPSSSNEVTASDIEDLPYLHAVCSESLRIYPTVPVTGRQAIRDTQILGTPVPKNTAIIISPWAVNRSKPLWGEDAEEFKPERWLGEGPAATHGGAGSVFSLITFLHGPRSCIGQTFARAELKCLLAAMVLKFDFRLKDPGAAAPMPVGLVTIKMDGGCPLRMQEL
ncbi:hypothetical protein MRB53_037180 [Persea americana]|nr:hypothetical protein MRB53_037180 [Persea americana]